MDDSEYNPEGPTSGLAGIPGRYPGVTTAAIVTEVADETAQGEYMALCAHAHLVADRALLQYLYDANGQRLRAQNPRGRSRRPHLFA